MTEIKLPTIEEIKAEAATYQSSDVGYPFIIITDEQAEYIQDQLLDGLAQHFADAIRDIIMEDMEREDL